MIRRIFHSVQKRGPARSLESLVSVVRDYFFDKAYGTDTSEMVEARHLHIPAEDQRGASRYQATRIQHFHRLMRGVACPDGSVFVDFGCGKGRVLLLASRYDFKRVVGIEISPELCEIARKNLLAYSKKSTNPSRVEIVQSSALEYSIRDDENVFYFFMPFENTVMEQVLENIIASLIEHPRKLWLLDYSSAYGSLFEAKSVFKKIQEIAYGGLESVVWVSE